MYRTTICTFLFCVLNVVFADLPSYVKICKRDPATISTCVKESIESIRPHLITGIPELKVPPVEPFKIPEVIAIHGELAPLKASAKNLEVTGFGDFSIKSLTVDLDKWTVNTKLRFPKLHVKGLYNLDTHILVVPLKGQGKFEAEASKCDANISMKFKSVSRDGNEYLKFDHIDIKLSMKDYQIRLDGLFNGDKTLGEATNQVINQNKEEFLKAILPYLENTVGKIVLDIASKITDIEPLSKVLPLP